MWKKWCGVGMGAEWGNIRKGKENKRSSHVK
jgi:hypothetical protein